MLKVFRACALISLALFLSTNFYGGNAFYFFGDQAVLAIRSISLVMTAVFVALYILAFRSDNKKYTERDGLTIREEAEQQMIASGLSIDQLKRIIEEGKVKQLGPRSRRVAEIDGYIYSVLLDNRGRVLEVSG